MKKDVAFCTPDDLLPEAVRLMSENACGCLPVIPSRHRPKRSHGGYHHRQGYLYGGHSQTTAQLLVHEIELLDAVANLIAVKIE